MLNLGFLKLEISLIVNEEAILKICYTREEVFYNLVYGEIPPQEDFRFNWSAIANESSIMVQNPQK